MVEMFIVGRCRRRWRAFVIWLEVDRMIVVVSTGDVFILEVVDIAGSCGG